jgi:DNA-binding protein HU-beta
MNSILTMESALMPTKSQAKAKVVKSSTNKTADPVTAAAPTVSYDPSTKNAKPTKSITPPTPTPPRNNISKKDIVTRVAAKIGLSTMVADIAVSATFDAMKDALLRGERIELRNFGVFEIKPRKAGFGRNPKTGKEVVLMEGRGKTVKFKMGKGLKE